MKEQICAPITSPEEGLDFLRSRSLDPRVNRLIDRNKGSRFRFKEPLTRIKETFFDKKEAFHQITVPLKEGGRIHKSYKDEYGVLTEKEALSTILHFFVHLPSTGNHRSGSSYFFPFRCELSKEERYIKVSCYSRIPTLKIVGGSTREPLGFEDGDFLITRTPRKMAL